jgi:hypothetical protein
MTATVQINEDLWTKFSGLAQQKRKRPNRLLENLIAEYPTDAVSLCKKICSLMKRSGNRPEKAAAKKATPLNW